MPSWAPTQNCLLYPKPCSNKLCNKDVEMWLDYELFNVFQTEYTKPIRLQIRPSFNQTDTKCCI